MHRIFRFKRYLRVEPLDAERTFLVSERERFLLRGGAYARVAPLLDGRRTVGELVEAIGGALSPPEILHALTLLEARGHVVEATDTLPPEIAGFWEAAGVGAAVAEERLAATPVAVGAVGTEDPGPIAEALAAAGVKVEDGASIRIVLTPDYLHDGLAVVAEQARLAGHRLFPLKATGIACWMGPMIALPGAARPCFACLAARIRANRPVEAYLERRRQGPGAGGAVRAPRVGLPTAARAAADLAALTVGRWIVDGGRGAVDDALLTVDPTTLRVEEHPVVRRPQCSACGDPGIVSRRAIEPIRLESRPKRFTLDGGHRAVPPEETLARHQRHLSQFTGVLSDLRDVGGDDPHRRVYSAVFRVCPSTSTPSFEDFHRLGSGKGRTAVQARAGALAEAIERYSERLLPGGRAPPPGAVLGSGGGCRPPRRAPVLQRSPAPRGHAGRPAPRALAAGPAPLRRPGDRLDPCKLGPRRLEEATAWLERYRQLWDSRFDALDDVVEELKRKETVDGRWRKE